MRATVVVFWWCFQVSVPGLRPVSANKSPPHIIIIMADDLGWNDVSFHGSDQFLTPNIDALAFSGVILKDYYTQPICTPSRAALLTGKHPISNGMENDVIYAPQPWGLPLTEQILPQYLRPMGYVSRAVGKWHLGFFHSNYTPTRRGFDSHYGIWLGHQNHVTHMGYESHPGFDFHRDLDFAWDAKGHYSVDLFTEEAEAIIQDHNASRPLFLYLAHTSPHAPLQAPTDTVRRFSYIPDKRRQKFAAMVTGLDESVGRVMTALKDNNMLNNSIVLFLTDNGGATHGFNGNVASNWPLRGCKDTLWEGGVRGVGLLWSPLLEGTPRVHHGLVNVQDWLPTLLEAAGEKAPNHIDGVSQWGALQQREDPPYSTMLHNSDPRRKIAALRHGDWKLVSGRTYNGRYDGFYGRLHGKVSYNLGKIRRSKAGKVVATSPSPLPDDKGMLSLRANATVSCNPQEVPESFSTTSPSVCKPHRTPCLFNLKEDPCEKRNLAAEFPDKLKQLISIWHTYHPVRPNNKPEDPRSYPEHWNNTWTTWMDFV